MTLSREAKEASQERRRSSEKVRQVRDEQAAALYLGGANLQQIANQLGFHSRISVLNSLNRTMLKLPTDPEALAKVREKHLTRLERLHMAWWPKAIAANPDPAAAVMVLRISERISKLLGLEREPLIDFEQQLRRAAAAEGLDADELVRDAEAIIHEYKPLWQQ